MTLKEASEILYPQRSDHDAVLEKLYHYEIVLASLCDTINQELRESGEFEMQIQNIQQDFRPFIRRLVDLNRIASQKPKENEG